ncbi:MAG: hypothetical protein K2L26_04035 [Duncaniella sp.]|nr:hypothetical protein [Duncaniella sp.]
MKIKRFLAMLMSAMVMMLCFTACDDKDEPTKPEPEPDPNEVAAPDFGEDTPTMQRDFRKGNFFKVFEYRGIYKHTDKTYGHMGVVTQEDKWYFYPADPEEVEKKRGYAHDGYLYNEYWQWADKDDYVLHVLYNGWKVYCEKKFGAVCNQYIYTGFNLHNYGNGSSLYGTKVDIEAFNDSQFVLNSSYKDYQEYFAYSFTDQTYDDSNSRFYGSVFDGAENMLREMYEYYGSAYVFLSTGDYYESDSEDYYSGTIGHVAKLLGITL